MTDSTVRVRIAPSPTGDWHLGNARTALFTYLLARKNNSSKFFLRIEDTDQSRLVPGAVDRLIEVLDWLGFDRDKFNGQDYIVQSERLSEYQEVAHRLVKEGKAFYCFATQEELQAMRDEQTKNKQPNHYDDRWSYRRMSLEQSRVLIDQGRPYVIRFKLPADSERVQVLIHGSITVQPWMLDNFVILKADGFPTYHLASVVDDQYMEITHVTRGDEWLISTPLHVALHKAINPVANPPQFAHFPVILGPDGGKLSKRHGAKPIYEYRDNGYLPEALLNYLLLLGWSSGDDREIFSLNDMVELFDLDRIQPNAAKFDAQKLEWFNQVYIQKDENLAQTIIQWYESKGESKWRVVYESEQASGVKKFVNLVESLRTKLKTLMDFEDMAKPYYELSSSEELEKILGNSKLTLPQVLESLRFLRPYIEESVIDQGDYSDAVNCLRKEFFEILEKENKPRGDFLWPLRAALSQQVNSPGAFESLVILGKEESLQRIDYALTLL